jgi:hypothetical protein
MQNVDTPFIVILSVSQQTYMHVRISSYPSLLHPSCQNNPLSLYSHSLYTSSQKSYSKYNLVSLLCRNPYIVISGEVIGFKLVTFFITIVILFMVKEYSSQRHTLFYMFNIY